MGLNASADMNPINLQRLLNLVGRVLEIVSTICYAIYLVLYVNDLLPYLPRLRALKVEDALSRVLMPILFASIAFAIAIWAADILKDYSRKMELDLEKRVIGTLEASGGKITVQEVAEIFKVRREQMMNFIQRLLGEGKLRGYILDHSTGTLSKGISVAPEAPLRQEMELRARLAELEVLRTEGKISERAYQQLKKELEEKLRTGPSARE